MAQNIEIANAQYNDVPSIEVPKQGGGTAEFVDTSDADAIASEIDMGKTAYVNGVKLTGTRSGGGSYTAGDGIDITNDVISLETASTTEKGGIIVGSGLSIDGNGVLSATGGGGGSSYSETVLFSNSSGVTSGSVTLNYNLSDYNMIQFTLIRTGSSTPKEIVTNMVTSNAVKTIGTSNRFCIHAFDNDYMDLTYANETTLNISGQRNLALMEVLGIKF